jgi:hypothetical protein
VSQKPVVLGGSLVAGVRLVVEEGHGLSRHGTELWLQIYSHSFANLSVLFVQFNRRTEETINIANTTCGIRFATSSSARKGIIRIGAAIYDTLGIETGREPITYSVTLGARTEQNPYTAELAAMAMALKRLSQHLVGRQTSIITSNLGALLATSQPRHQSG